jgi:8-oxo-dGTP pyrophosphatase MutT (NUDIX family)
VTDGPNESAIQRFGRLDRREGEPIPAATVVLVRDGDDGVETLMLHKNSKIAFGGMWVFPGGRIDPADAEGTTDLEGAARRAAAREAFEEAGLTVDADSMAWISNWLPPPIAPVRYATWFFVAPAPEGAVTIDMGEIHDSAWMRPADAITRRDAQEVELAPPTWMTLHYLARFDSIDALMVDAHALEPGFFETHMGRGERGMAALWPGDAGYDNSDLDAPGPRNRLWMDPNGWYVEDTRSM